MSNTALPIHWDRPCYKCRSSFCDGLCTPLPDPASNVFAAPWKSGDTPSLYKEGTVPIHGIPCYTADQLHAHAAAVSADKDARIKVLEDALRGLDEAYCRAGAPLTREQRMEDRKRLIAARAALGDKTPNDKAHRPA